MRPGPDSLASLAPSWLDEAAQLSRAQLGRVLGKRLPGCAQAALQPGSQTLVKHAQLNNWIIVLSEVRSECWAPLLVWPRGPLGYDELPRR